MTTVNPRINVTLDPQMFGLIGSLAKKENKSVSAKAAELLQTAIELDEDLYYAKLCEERLKNTTKFYSHEEVMKMVFKDD
jgi:predicted DNA-binding protein